GAKEGIARALEVRFRLAEESLGQGVALPAEGDGSQAAADQAVENGVVLRSGDLEGLPEIAFGLLQVVDAEEEVGSSRTEGEGQETGLPRSSGCSYRAVEELPLHHTGAAERETDGGRQAQARGEGGLVF